MTQGSQLGTGVCQPWLSLGWGCLTKSYQSPRVT